ncbi:MAG: asparagine synthase (glutamine-hydrolyzing), partial [Rhodocyclaceae bacterium]|nr:asparagine synthase (glutamine-hydrolyzing) [Rhodocyclaceae bacterium]
AGRACPDLAPALASLRHRGPDAQAGWSEGAIVLGHARLAILDLSPLGAQPMQSPDGRFVIVFNGEIYNFPELRTELETAGETFAGHSDTEVLLRLYQREGEACLAKLRGMFAFAVWDRSERRLFLARDRLGVKPLVYAETERGLLFGSEIQSLFALDPQLSRQADLTALDHYLTYQYIPAPMSGFAAIRKLPPAHAMTVRDGRIERLWRWWRLDPSRQSGLSFADACAAVREAVLEATRIRLLSDVPLGAFLSGGIDSSITVAAMTRVSPEPVRTFAIGFEDEEFNELPYARQVAEHLGTRHHEMLVKADAADLLPQIIGHFGEPHADSSAIPTLCVSRFARSQVTVALTGDGGDESFAGYRRFWHASLAARLEQKGLLGLWRGARRLTSRLERKPFPRTRADEGLGLPADQRYAHLMAYFSEAEKAALLTPEFRARLGASRAAAFVGELLTEAAAADPINRHLYADLHTYLPEDVLAKVDICSMMVSLECRSPFLDHRLIELAFSLPGHYKMRWPHRHKHLLKEAFKDWLPPGFMERRKQGFSVPLARWLRTDLAGLLQERLLTEDTLAGVVDTTALQTQVREHLANTRSHAKRLWALLVLAEWMKTQNVTL